jgi:hypothetical protein
MSREAKSPSHPLGRLRLSADRATPFRLASPVLGKPGHSIPRRCYSQAAPPGPTHRGLHRRVRVLSRSLADHVARPIASPDPLRDSKDLRLLPVLVSVHKI